MLLSLRNELRVVLCRDEVQMVHIGRKLTVKGVSCQVLEKKVFSCEEDADQPWKNAVMTLETALSGLSKKQGFAQVILSNHFIRYTMVPWSESLNSEAEEIVYAKHCFSQLYGVSADTWDLRMNQDFAGAPQFASAVDSELLQSLRNLFAAANIKLKSVQPHLMTAYNNCHAHLKNHEAWLVLFEHGNLCMGLIQKGHWRSVRTIKVRGDWLEKLPEILDREASLSELDAHSDEVFLWAPEHWKEPLPKSAHWKIHKLQPMIRSGFAPEYDARFAMALCG